MIEELGEKRSSSSPAKSKSRASILNSESLPANNEKHITGVKHEFEKYKGIWEKETLLSSSTTEMTNHPAYLHIIALGTDVVPLLLRDMLQSSNHWFSALQKLTGANPVPKDHRGKIQLMIGDWVKWAKNSNIDF